MTAELQAELAQPQNFCGISNNLLELARTGQYRWQKHDLTFCIVDRVPGFQVDDFAGVIHKGFTAWTDICDRTIKPVTDYRKADFLVLARRIDGRNGILAEHQLPPGNDMQLRGWLDLGERWTLEMLLGVWTHEVGHGFGISHTDVPKSLMNPYYNPAISTPQQWDRQAIESLYGPKPAGEPLPPVPTTPVTPGEFVGLMELSGAVYDFKATRRL